ncbi:hypothetical protein V495_03681 [Pseudogymnoascus sp. VKM F-4514 (FW-929)]|nr:hypothetical protein V495_03681 [Pseudogymnoascus sp. VKM F-4514 (FW-929)]KFY54988.1 hypothetical protein V497_07298 [Pseudogymnoascus sp. VKM F-4516 (FW-969)]
MKEYLNVTIHADDWSGRAGRATRKTIQNRLSQRARRERKRRGEPPHILRVSTANEGLHGVRGVLKVRNDLAVRYSINDRSIHSLSSCQSKIVGTSPSNHTASSQTIEQQVAHWMLYWLSHRALIKDSTRNTLVHIERAFSTPKTLFPLPADHLLTLVHYNVLRAFIANALSLNLDPERMCFELPSPFTTSDSEIPRLIPPSLHPTPLQRTRSHHPFIDLFPCATVRHNVLAAAEDKFDDEDLFQDIFGTRFLKGNVGVTENVGMVVWGDPWRVESWEITEGCWKKWRWMFMGCTALLDATNSWRNMRDEAALNTAL